MKYIKSLRVIVVLTLILLLVGLPIPFKLQESAKATPRADSSSKLSPDLLDQLRKARANSRVTAIVQFN
ncbi:MAG: hypothetical protein ICV68_07555, partial [Pyrinomonadaceae bacterium]|nr:hypothetical protein [Pyrinomonadaceae bacterium]